MRRADVRRVVLLAVAVGTVGAIGPYLMLISPMEHLREWARAEFELEGPGAVLARFAAWSLGGAVAALLLSALPSPSRSEDDSGEGDR